MLIWKVSLSRLMVLRIKKSRRKFVAAGLDIAPYRKKPKMLLSCMLPRSDVIRNKVPTSLFYAKVSDFLWMVQCSLSNNVEIWVGRSATFLADKSPINRIFYLSQNISVTDSSYSCC